MCCRCISSISRACPLSRQRTKASDRDPREEAKQVLHKTQRTCIAGSQPPPPKLAVARASVINQPSVDTQSRTGAQAVQQLTIEKVSLSSSGRHFVISSSFPALLARSSLPVNFSILPLRKSRGTSYLRADVRRGRCVTPMHRQRVTRSRRRVGATRAFEFSDENGSCGEASTARGIRTPARAPRRCRSWIRGCEKSGSSNRAYSSSLIVARAATGLSYLYGDLARVWASSSPPVVGFQALEIGGATEASVVRH